jgi:hypothetical protein
MTLTVTSTTNTVTVQDTTNTVGITTNTNSIDVSVGTFDSAAASNAITTVNNAVASITIKTFATRAEAVTYVNSNTFSVGTIIKTSGADYRYVGSGVPISDMPGWIWDKDLYPEHLGITNDGSDATAKLQAFCTYEAAISASNYAAPNRISMQFGPGTWLITGAVEFPAHVDVHGAGRALTVFNCTGGGQLRFGPDPTGVGVTASRGGKSGGFCVSGDNSTNTKPPFDTGFAVERSFQDIVVKTSFSDGLVLNGAQNCDFISLTITACDGKGLVLDYGAGNNRFFGYEIEGNGIANIEIRQSGTSPTGAFSEPTNNQFIAGVLERRKSGGSWVATINQTAGKNNRMVAGNIALTGQTSTQPIVRLRKAGSNPSTFAMENVFCNGTAAYTTLLDVDDATSLFFSGTVENQSVFAKVGDSARVYVDNINSIGGVTTTFANQSGGTQPERNLLRYIDKIVAERSSRATASDIFEQTFVTGESQPRAQRQSNGYVQYGSGSATVDTQIGRVSRFGIPGVDLASASSATNFVVRLNNVDLFVLSSAPSQAANDGSVAIRTDTGEAYTRQAGAWIKIQTTTSGTTASRPTAGLIVGQMYYDTTLGYPVYYTGSGSVWHNGSGATV